MLQDIPFDELKRSAFNQFQADGSFVCSHGRADYLELRNEVYATARAGVQSVFGDLRRPEGADGIDVFWTQNVWGPWIAASVWKTAEGNWIISVAEHSGDQACGPVLTRTLTRTEGRMVERELEDAGFGTHDLFPSLRLLGDVAVGSAAYRYYALQSDGAEFAAKRQGVGALPVFDTLVGVLADDANEIDCSASAILQREMQRSRERDQSDQ